MGWSTTSSDIEYMAARVALHRRLVEGILNDEPEFADPSAWEAFLEGGETELALEFEEQEPPGLKRLVAQFGLTLEEERLLVLIAATEFDPSFRELIEASGMGSGGEVTLQFAVTFLPELDWNYLSPGGMLRLWEFVELGPSVSLMSSPLRLSERILMFVSGIDQLDERLMRMARMMLDDERLSASQEEIAEKIGAIWTRRDAGKALPLIVLTGATERVAGTIMSSACIQAEYTPWMLHANTLQLDATEVERLARLWEREFFLARYALFLVVDAEFEAQASPNLLTNLREFLDIYRCPLVLACGDPRSVGRETVRFHVELPEPEEQEAAWYEALDWEPPSEEEFITRLAYQFDLTVEAIRSIATKALASWAYDDELEKGPQFGPSRESVWSAAKSHGLANLSRLATRLDARGRWEDLILPDDRLRELMDLCEAVRLRPWLAKRLREDESDSSRGMGTIALFSGESGTGKTRASEIIASELNLNLFRIDLNSVVSKYIGETEKNLEDLFRQARAAGAILLFDEADALFGRRTEVTDSHDRYANQGVSYLLQSLESYRGLAILTTNMRESIDRAFRRRIAFEIAFPFPDEVARERLWESTLARFDSEGELSPRALARMSLSGGSIRTVAANAALLAASSKRPLGIQEILIAAQREYAKLGLSFPLEWPFLEEGAGTWK